ncbi:hypothetical protein [Comamonas sp.]|uniref:hypothetical protein n=1 Tax=Comamonas sp. TaxID=34028 RepID=UPI0028A2A1A4|nr:hypothetical protein [Comamonas sp.]
MLGIKLEPGTAKKLAIEAAGSPQLMQSICLNIARDLGAREGKFDTPVELDITNNLMGKVCVKIASSGIDYSSTIEEMKKGPLTRGRDRKIYNKVDGSELDIYHLIVEGLAIDPPTLKFTDKDLLNRVESLVNVKVSNYWDSVRHISQIANKQGSEMKIDFGEELRWVTILDPYLLFALRWSK